MSPAGEHAWSPYCGPAPLPDEMLGRWNLDPFLLAGLATIVLGWLIAGRDNSERKALFAAAFAITFVLFVSPFCALTSALFSARVVHHVVLTGILAPVFVFSFPRKRIRSLGPLAGWTIAQAIVFWLWHAPGAYEAALANNAVYWLMQGTLLGSSLAFWSALRRASLPAAIGALLITVVQMGLLGALITFARSPLYAPHFLTTEVWGLSPLQDQQLAGLIMWAPAAGLYLAAALALASRWLKSEDRLAA